MATEDREKGGLRRKLTGPPRLLLGKTRTRSVGEDRPEKVDEVDEQSLKSPAAAAENEIADLRETLHMEDEILSAESYRGRCGVTGEDGVTSRKVNRCRWWRRFSLAVVCTSRQKKNVEGGLEKQEKTSEGNDRERKRFNMTFRRFQSRRDRPSLTFQKKLRRLFARGGRSRASGVALENAEDDGDEQPKPQSEEDLSSPDCQVHDAGTDPVSAEMSLTAWEDRVAAESPELLRADTDNTKKDMMDTADGSAMTQTGTGTAEEPADSAPVGHLVQLVPSDKDGGLSSDALDGEDHLSASPTSSDVHNEQNPQPPQAFTNGPSIRIDLVPPDDIALQDEEEYWGGRSSSQNQNQLHLLLGFDHIEQQLLQTARSLVRTAMNAAVDQLSREQRSGSEHVHREPQGCRDHA